MLMQRGVNLCGIEQWAWTTTASTGDVPLGVPYNFTWNTSTDGQVKYSNCTYSGESFATIVTGAEDCGVQCTATPSCDKFSWWGGWCNMIAKSVQVTPSLASSPPEGRCGQVVNRVTFDFKSGSNGLAMYAPNCGYTSLNSQTLQWQYSDEADCGAVCSTSSSCSYFAFVYGYCNMYAIANQSLALTPSPYASDNYYSICGYVTSRNTIVPKWQSTSNGQIMSARNCGYIGTDPTDVGIQSKNSQWLNEENCGSLCAATSNCTYYSWSNNWCHLMSIVKPVVYYSVAGSCGYVVNRKPIAWRTNGQFKTSANCTFTVGAYIGYGNIGTIGSCASICNNNTECSLFFLSSGWCNLISFTGPALPIYSNSSSCGKIPNRITAG